jgi:hypothetical protein
MPILLLVLALSIGLTATLLGALSITADMGAARRMTVVTREQRAACAAAYLLLVITLAARMTGRL